MLVFLFASISAAGAIICFVFGLLVFLKDQRSRLNQVFMLLCFSMTYWSVVQFELRSSGTAEQARFWIRANFIWPATVALLLHFTLVFTRHRRLLASRFFYPLLYGPALAVMMLILTTDLLVGAPTREYWGWTFEVPDNGVYQAATAAFAFVAVTALLLAMRFHRSLTDRVDRRQSRLVLIGLAIPVTTGVFTEVIFPAMAVIAPDITPLAFAIGAAGVIGYAIRHYELFEITLTRAANKIINATSDILLLVDPFGNVIRANQAATDLLGFQEKELIGRPADRMFAEFPLEMVPKRRHGTENSFERITDLETNLLAKNGCEIPVSVSDSVMRDEYGRVLGAVIIARDITERMRAERALRESESRLKAIMESVQTGITIINPVNHKIVDANAIAVSMIGEPKEEIIGAVCHRFICPAEVGKCPITDLHQTVDNSERVLLSADGEKVPIIKSVTMVKLGGSDHLLESFISIAERKLMEEQLNKSLAEKEVLVRRLNELATRDDLTGLYNHRAFYALLSEELMRSARFERPVSLLMLDIDYFKLVNDTHGHLAGDLVLNALSSLLTSQSRAIDRVCRYGGEEITVILPEAESRTAFEAAERLREAVESHPFEAAGVRPLRITVSIGVASAPADASTAQDLVAAADAAMFAAKRRGRNRVVRYERALSQTEIRR